MILFFPDRSYPICRKKAARRYLILFRLSFERVASVSAISPFSSQKIGLAAHLCHRNRVRKLRFVRATRMLRQCVQLPVHPFAAELIFDILDIAVESWILNGCSPDNAFNGAERLNGLNDLNHHLLEPLNRWTFELPDAFPVATGSVVDTQVTVRQKT